MLEDAVIKEENKDKVYWGDINYLNDLANDYNIGGVPLPLFLLCRKLTTSNCFLISRFVFDIWPEAELVQGQLESYMTASNCNGLIKNNCKGYHVWIEVGDKVYDPVLAMFFDKQFYYNQEKAVVLKRTTHDEELKSCSYSNIIPTKEKPSCNFSKYRQFMILEIMKPFIEQESWIYEKPLKTGFQEFYDSLDVEKIKETIKKDIPSFCKENFNEIYEQLMFDKKYDQDGFQASQREIVGFLGRQLRQLTSINSLDLGDVGLEETENAKGN